MRSHTRALERVDVPALLEPVEHPGHGAGLVQRSLSWQKRSIRTLKRSSVARTPSSMSLDSRRAELVVVECPRRRVSASAISATYCALVAVLGRLLPPGARPDRGGEALIWPPRSFT